MVVVKQRRGVAACFPPDGGEATEAPLDTRHHRHQSRSFSYLVCNCSLLLLFFHLFILIVLAGYVLE